MILDFLYIMSQNATSRNRGLEKSTKTSHIDLNKQNMKQNQKSTNLSNSKVTSIGNNSDANISRIINHQSTQPVSISVSTNNINIYLLLLTIFFRLQLKNN